MAQFAGTNPNPPDASAKGRTRPKKPTELGRRFAFWADTVQRTDKTLEVIKTWIDGVAKDNKHRSTLLEIATRLAIIVKNLGELKTLWAKLTDDKFVTPKLMGPQGFVKGAVIKYRPDEMKRLAQYEGDVEVYSGEFVITHVDRNPKTGALLLGGHSKSDKAHPFGHVSSNKFKLVS